VEYYPPLKRKNTGYTMEKLENIILSEISQSPKYKYHMIAGGA
jgi:hypothetical protein